MSTMSQLYLHYPIIIFRSKYNSYVHSTMKYSYYPYFQIISIDFQHFHRLILSIFPCDIHHLSPFFFPPRDGAGALVT